MTEFTNITTREEFDDLLVSMRTQDIVVADTETNGLRYYRDNCIISISIYFPKLNTCYNIPYRHGEGSVDVRWNRGNPKGSEFHDMTWGGNPKKDMYLGFWFDDFSRTQDFENIPIEWVEELKAVWGRKGVTYIFHNARFDLHMLEADGFPRIDIVEDTMLMLHTVFEDWVGIELTAPYTHPQRAGKKLAGRWAMQDGELLTKKQIGNRRLKWQAAFIGLPGATMGETELLEARDAFEVKLVDHIMDNLDNPINAGLVLKTEAGRSSPSQRYNVSKKINISSKANMWMLPSSDVALYAMLDVVLTWGLHQHYYPMLENWHSVDLYYHQCAVAYELCWRMERNGVKIDYDNAIAEILILDLVISSLGADLDKLMPNINVSSPTQLKPALIALGYDIQKTDKPALEPYIGDRVIDLILEYRKAKKSRDTYLKAWVADVDPDGILHYSMNADGTYTGRLSSSNPNFQNIPTRGGYTVKRAIVPYDKNWVMFGLDFGQIEARVACWITDNLLGYKSNMTKLFESGVDVHIYTRDKLDVRHIMFGDLSLIEICDKLGYTGLDNPEATALRDLRHIAKTLNFGLLYSGGKRMIAKELRIDEDTAATLVEEWRFEFPEFRRANEMLITQGSRWRDSPSGDSKGMYVTQPISGRHRKIHKYATFKRYLDDDGVWKDFNPQEAAARNFLNSVVQGLCGYICLTSGLNIARKYGDDILRPFANIHDALDFYIHVDHMHIIKDIMAIMEDWDMINPAMTVNLEASPDTWQDFTEVKDIDIWINSKGQDGYAS